MGKEVQRYADGAMFTAEPMQSKLPQVHLLNVTRDPLGAIAAACRMYEGKTTVLLEDITDDERRHYWKQVQQTHLKAPLEFVELHFFVEGVDRALTHQMVRQRTAVFAQESMRFAVKENLQDAVQPGPSIAGNRSREERYYKAIAAIQEAYDWLIGDGVPAEDARGLLPHDTLTRLNYKTNLRNLFDHAGNRLCTQAQFKWRIVFSQIVKAIRSHHDDYFLKMHPGAGVGWRADGKWQFETIADSDMFRPVCYQMGHCPFTASFDRGCTIRDRVQQGKFDEISDQEWALDPEAAWVR